MHKKESKALFLTFRLVFTDQRTDKASCRVASPRQKTCCMKYISTNKRKSGETRGVGKVWVSGYQDVGMGEGGWGVEESVSSLRCIRVSVCRGVIVIIGVSGLTRLLKWPLYAHPAYHAPSTACTACTACTPCSMHAMHILHTTHKMHTMHTVHSLHTSLLVMVNCCWNFFIQLLSFLCTNTLRNFFNNVNAK